MKTFDLEEAAAHAHQIQDLELCRVGYTKLEKGLSNLPGLRRLSIQKSRLQKLPPSLFCCTKLTTLILDENKICELPEALARLQHLHTLSISNNELQAISEVLGCCATLRRLQLSGNKLKQWPAVLARLPWLSTLSLSFNHITSLPDTLPAFATLRHLDLSNNQLSSLPRAVHFPQLETLILRNNHLKHIPDSWLASTHLLHLDISENPIEVIPKLPKCLKYLKIAPIPLKSFPEALLQVDGPLEVPQLPAKLQQQLNAFLKVCQKVVVPLVHRKVLFDAYCGDEDGLNALSRQDWLQYLAIPLPGIQALLIRRLVVKHNFPDAGMGVALLGKKDGYPTDWQSKIAGASGTYWVDAGQADWLVIGKSPYRKMPAITPQTRFTTLSGWWSELFCRQEEVAWSFDQKEQLRRLLRSPHAGNQALATHLIQAGGLPVDLRNDAMFAWWTATSPNAKRAIYQQLARSLDPESAVILKLPWHARLRLVTDFVPWMFAMLENSPFCAETLLALLKEGDFI